MRSLRHSLRAAATGLLTIGLLACSDDSEERSSTSAQEVASICQKYVEHEQDCGNESTLEECEGAFKCEPVMRPDTVANIFTCFAELACNESDDSCSGGEFAKHEEEPTYVTFYDTCRSKMVDECQKSDDFCAMSYMNDDTLAACSECMNKSCDEIESCLSDVILSRAPGCTIMK